MAQRAAESQDSRSPAEDSAGVVPRIYPANTCEQTLTTTDVVSTPILDSSGQGMAYLTDGIAADNQQTSVFGGLPDMYNFSTEPDWQLAFPSGMPSPVNNLFVSSLLPWKDFSADNFLGNGDGSSAQNNAASSGLAAPTQDIPRRQPEPVMPNTEPESGSITRSSSSSMPTDEVDLSLFDVTDHQRELLQHFSPATNPIPLLVPLDSQWRSAYTSLMSMACGCSCLTNAICSISELHLTSSRRGSVGQALSYYEKASTKAESILNNSTQRVDNTLLKQAFATIFLLMHAEMMAQPLAGPKRWPTTHLRTAYRWLKQYNHRIRLWTGVSSHILSWIQVMDSKAVYAAGMEDEKDRPSPSTDATALPSPNVTLDTNSPMPTNSVYICSEDAGTLRPEPILDTDYDDHNGGDESFSAAEIAYDAINTPAYKFFLRCQSLIPRVISLDLHHRPRGSLDAEFEVLQIGQRLRAELKQLWARRPRELNVLDDSSGLRDVLHPSVARKITQAFRIYVANFHALRIILHRVAFSHYPTTDEVKQSISEILRLVNEQLASTRNDTGNSNSSPNMAEQQTSRKEPEDNNIATTSETLSPGTPWLWPLFMCGLECTMDKRHWILELMRNMKTKDSNAEKTAILLAEVTKRQDAKAARIDQRTVRADIFEDEFCVVY